MLHDLLDRDSGIHISVQHCANQVDTIIAHHVGNSKVPVHDFVNAVEGILFVDDSVKENT